MPAHTPEEVHQLFAAAFQTRDLHGILALYEQDAAFLLSPGTILVGRDAIREHFQTLLALTRRFELAVDSSCAVGNVAVLHSRWKLSGTRADGSPLQLSGWTADVVRRQHDGSWLLAIDNPNGGAAASSNGAADEAFWRGMLNGVSGASRLGIVGTSDAPVYALRAVQDLRLDPTVIGALAGAAERHAISLATFVRGAWALLLSRYRDDEDVLFGLVVSGALFPFRVSVPHDACVVPWLRELQHRVFAARDHASSTTSLDEPWILPLGTSPFESVVVSESSAASMALPPVVQLVVEAPEGEPQVRVRYDGARFAADMMERLLGHLVVLLHGMATRPDARLGELPLLTEAERRRILVEWTATARDYPLGHCVHELIERQAARTPDAPALLTGNGSLSYRELNRRANRVAGLLREHGVGPEVRVGIALERSVGMVAAVLAVLKAGGAFVPMDMDEPTARVRQLLDDSGARVVITRSAFCDQLGTPDVPLVIMDDQAYEAGAADDHNPSSGATPDNLAYVLFTSGSTGRPKSVLVEHRSLVNYLCWVNEDVLRDPIRLVPLLARLTFDACLKQILAPLLSGGPVWVVPGDAILNPSSLLAVIEARTGIGLNLVPWLWKRFLDSLGPADAVRLGRSVSAIMLAGEVVTEELLRRTRAALPATQIWNLYGPTECTANASAGRVVDGGRITIGRAIANTRLYVLDGRLRAVPVGVAGELYIGGLGVARGYGSAALTALRFVPDPFDGGAGGRLYRTGDRVRWCGNGELDFLGRVDEQVKVRGVRTEPAEIAAALLTHPAVKEAAVVPWDDGSGQEQLVAYVAPHEQPEPGEGELRRFLTERLPRHMIPAAFMVLDALPITSRGKLDKHALPPPPAAASALGGRYVAPRTPMEASLAGIWSEVLGRERIGVYDDFFDLGGHSLHATRIVARASETLGCTLPLTVVFEAATVAALAERAQRGD